MWAELAKQAGATQAEIAEATLVSRLMNMATVNGIADHRFAAGAAGRSGRRVTYTHMTLASPSSLRRRWTQRAGVLEGGQRWTG